MNIFVLTDNLVWFERAQDIFLKNGYKVDFYCSPKGSHLFKEEIEQKKIKVIDLKNKNDISLLVESYRLGFSCHCKQIFPLELVGSIRCINIHPGFNPYNRGWFPQVFSIINKKPIGVTIHLMDAEIDHGDILFQEEVSIEPWETSKDVYEKILEKEFEVFSKNIKNIVEGKYGLIKPSSAGNYNSIKDYKKLTEINLDEKVTMGEAIDYLRAMTHQPYSNAFFKTENGEKIFVSVSLSK